MKTKKLKHSTLFALLVYLLIGLLPPGASSLTMSGESLNLEINSLDVNPRKQAPKPATKTNEQQPMTNDHIKIGFLPLPQNAEFTFSLSETNIDFGIVTATNPNTRTSTLTITNQSSPFYQITAHQDHQLLIPPKEPIIPDTTCDNGSCTETTSALWTNTLTYGFGYRCESISGSACSQDFNTANYYKQFADISKSEAPQAIMTGRVGSDIQSKIIYKINTNNTQPSGLYTNNIIYIATPSF